MPTGAVTVGGTGARSCPPDAEPTATFPATYGNTRSSCSSGGQRSKAGSCSLADTGVPLPGSSASGATWSAGVTHPPAATAVHILPPSEDSGPGRSGTSDDPGAAARLQSLHLVTPESPFCDPRRRPQLQDQPLGVLGAITQATWSFVGRPNGLGTGAGRFQLGSHREPTVQLPFLRRPLGAGRFRALTRSHRNLLASQRNCRSQRAHGPAHRPGKSRKRTPGFPGSKGQRQVPWGRTETVPGTPRAAPGSGRLRV